jgi:hypothetical protein
VITRAARTRVWSGGAFLAIASLIAAACGVSNDKIEIDEFFRPLTRGVAAADDPADPPPNGDAEQAKSNVADAQADPGGSDQIAPGASNGDGVDIANDIVRRYRNPTYGYSFDLVCGPFCDINPGGIDLIGFQSSTDPGVINVSARLAEPGASLASLETVWLDIVLTGTTPNVLARQESTLASDRASPVLIVDWETDRRATGGGLERWRSLITQVGPIAYFINAGTIADLFPAFEGVFQQTLDSFLAPADPPSLPGRYTRFDFAVEYDINGFVGELGLAGVSNQPTADGGRFFLQGPDGILQFILIWEALSQAIYDADAAIDADAEAPGAVSVTEASRADFQLSEGISGRVAGFSAADAAGDAIPLRVFSWYCEEGGRSFTLQSLSDAERPALLDTFRCAVPAAQDGA